MNNLERVEDGTFVATKEPPVEISPEEKKARLTTWLAKRTPPDLEDHMWREVPLRSLSNKELRVIIHVMYVRAQRKSERLQ